MLVWVSDRLRLELEVIILMSTRLIFIFHWHEEILPQSKSIL